MAATEFTIPDGNWKQLENDRREFFASGEIGFPTETFLRRITPPQKTVYSVKDDWWAFARNSKSNAIPQDAREGHTLRLSPLMLSHDTGLAGATGIFSDGAFRGQKKTYKEGGRNILGEDSATLVWFTVRIPADKTQQMRQNMKERMKDYLQASLADTRMEHLDKYNGSRSYNGMSVIDHYNEKMIGSTLPFNEENSPLGNYRFPHKLEDLVMHYKRSLGCEEVEYRQLGTCYYQKGIMHAVLVCPNDGKFAHFPPVPLLAEPGPAIWKDENGWAWRPSSTGGNYLVLHASNGEASWPELFKHSTKQPRCDVHEYRCWDHISFAFYLPKDQLLEVPREDMKAALCIVDNKDTELDRVYRGRETQWDSQTAAEKLADGLGYTQMQKDELKGRTRKKIQR